MKEIDYYKNNEILENSYYQIPQELLLIAYIKKRLNSDSKILYAFLQIDYHYLKKIIGLMNMVEYI